MAAENRDLDRAHPRRMQALLALLPLLGVFGFIAGAALGLRETDLILLGLALTTAIVAFLPLTIDQGRRPSERHILLSTILAFFVISFVVPVFAVFIPGPWPKDAPSYSYSNLFPRDVIRGQLTSVLALASLLLGYAVPLGPALAAPIPRFRRDWSQMQTIAIALVMIPFGWAIMLAGLLGVFSAALGSGAVGVLGSSYVYGIALLAIAYLRHRSRVALTLLAVVVPVTSAFGLFTGSKGAILISGAMVVFAIVVVRRRLQLRWVLAGVAASALVYPVGVFVREDILAGNTLTVIHALRDFGGTSARIADFISSNRGAQYFAEGLGSSAARFDSLGASSVIVRDTPSVAPFLHGETLVLYFYAFVPRLIWPSKPAITTGRYVTDVYGSGPQINSSTAPTQIGDYFMNFGYPGVVGGLFLFGLLLRVGHEVLLRRSPTTPALFAAVVVVHHLGLDFQGNVANMYAVTTWSILVIVVVHAAMGLLVAPRAPTHASVAAVREMPGRGRP